MEQNDVQQSIDHGDGGYEKRDVNLARILVYGLLGILILTAVVVFALDYFTAVREEIIYEARLRPESAQLRDLRAREEQELNSYAVLDGSKGIYRIPIDRAMEVIAEEAYRLQKK